MAIPLATVCAQERPGEYKKRVLESTEIDVMASYYMQEGENAAVTGGRGTEELRDVAPTIVVAIPLNDDDVLTIDASISAYTSASSSNINPFDKGRPDPFVASTGASSSDVWTNFSGIYSHSSDDRNQTLAGKFSVSSEFDYFSLGVGGEYARQLNEKNTELSLKANVYLDTWTHIYPFELRPFLTGGDGLNNWLLNGRITGNTNYEPRFTALSEKKRNSYSVGLGFSQILSKKLQGSLAADWVLQQGLLSMPFQRVYFADVPNSYVDGFHLADDIERLPSTRVKIALGGRLHYFVNEHLTVRTFYRYYTDDWGIRSNTASLELPVKVGNHLTLTPGYRYYDQTAADYFAPYDQLLSTSDYYTSDYDFSKFNANQYSFGVAYTDVFTKGHIWIFHLKSAELKYSHYQRNNAFKANIVSMGIKMVPDFKDVRNPFRHKSN